MPEILFPKRSLKSASPDYAIVTMGRERISARYRCCETKIKPIFERREQLKDCDRGQLLLSP